MNLTAKLEISILSAALALGILGDALLRCFPWGTNFALWAAVLAAVIFALGRHRAFAAQGRWLLLPLFLAPLAFLWHEAAALEALNMLALLTALSAAMLRAQGEKLRA